MDQDIQRTNGGFVRVAMKHPITVLVISITIILGGILSLVEMPRDLLPSLGVPIIYVAQPYGGLDASQMESYLTYYYEYHFLYITGIEHVESKNIQSTALIKLQFYPGTNMAQAMAETINYVNRAKAFMPPGTLPPFVMRFDAGSEPVGDLVFSSRSRSVGELQNYALNFVRPMFATLPGVSAPPPFGSSQRTIVIRVHPGKLRAYNLSAYDVAEAVAEENKIVPSGNIQTGNQYPIVPLNSVVTNIKELEDIPLRLGTYPTVFLGDVASVEDGTDIQTGYALVNGKRTVYIPVTKRADASTLSVVSLVKKNLPRFQSVLPDDIRVTYEFDQSGYVRRAINSLAFEGFLGALLTGLMVLLFLRDLRSALVVVLNIPLALLVGIIGLWVTGQTVNIMTLGGLALAVGILVDESTVTIENIHVHFRHGHTLARAAMMGTSEIFKPALISMLCILAVLIPSFFMTGISRALFVPLTLSVGFSIIGAFLLSNTLVPVLVTWFLRESQARQLGHEPAFDHAKKVYAKLLEKIFGYRKTVILFYLLICAILIYLGGTFIRKEIFPQVDTGQLQIRLRAPTGSTIGETEKLTLRVIEIVKALVGPENVETSLAFVGAQPPNYPINTVYLWTSGPQEAVLQMAIKLNSESGIEGLKEQIRGKIHNELPHAEMTFEPSSLVDRALSEGSPTQIEVSVNGRDLDADRKVADEIRNSLSNFTAIRDLQYRQIFEYPAIAVNVDRRKAGLQGVKIGDIGKAVVPATSSSRYVLPNYWSDPKNGINYQLQVEVPQTEMSSMADMKKIPISLNGGSLPLDRFVRSIEPTSRMGEFDRYNMQRMATVTANLFGIDLGHASHIIAERLMPIRQNLPKGVELHIRGQIEILSQMKAGLTTGLLFTIVLTLLLLAGNFESLSLSFIVMCSIPAVLTGTLLTLGMTGTSLNIESFMGTIMAIGVSVANAILLVTFAERSRISGQSSWQAAVDGAVSRLRPILMTTIAMISGMVPMALGLGEGSQQTAPLARSVIGGLIGSTTATLLVLPIVYALVRHNKSRKTASLDPGDPQSVLYKRADL